MPPTKATAAPLRWLAAAICILYGFAKLNGSQFTILDSELARPLGEVSGFWLTWYYFGYSWPYGTLIALLQIGAGVLLVLPRTALLGALCLLPIFTNILLVDVFFSVEPGATAVAFFVLICLIAVIGPHTGRLRAAVMLDATPGRSTLRLAALAAIIAGAWAFTWWVANYNNRDPTPIDGVWSVVSQSGADATPRWQQVFFERNRAYWVVFRTREGADERHHFEVDGQGVVRVWQTWLTKGPLIMQGGVNQDGLLELKTVGNGGDGRLLLRRKK